MKKLMITACCLMTGVVIGATPMAQVYDVVLKIKTTSAASATLNNKQNPLAVGTDDGSCAITYRKQSTATWKGIIWGCGCEAIDGTWKTVKNECDDVEVTQIDTIKGCIIWDDKTKIPVYIGNGSNLTDADTVPGTGFGWEFIHAINKDAKQVEGLWNMTQNGNACDENGVLFNFIGSGFGTSVLYVDEGQPTCLSYIKSITGDFAGYMKAPTKTNVKAWSGCTYCGLTGGDITCDFAEAWNWCKWYNGCACYTDVEDNTEYTAAYGTWTIKYNASLSKKLSQPVKISTKGIKGVVVSIRDVYDFKKLPYVEAAIETVENKIWGINTPCEDLEEEIAEATESVKIAQANVDAVSTERLASDVTEAKANQYAANTNLVAKTAAFNKAEYKLKDATYDYNKMSNTLATASWKIEYINSSSKFTSENGIGLESFADKIDDLQYFTVTKYEFNKEPIYPTTYNEAKKYVVNKQVALNNLKVDLENKIDVYENAVSDKDKATILKNVSDSEVATAEMRYEDRVHLQFEAGQTLLIAQKTLNDLEEEYDANGCK